MTHRPAGAAVAPQRCAAAHCTMLPVYGQPAEEEGCCELCQGVCECGYDSSHGGERGEFDGGGAAANAGEWEDGGRGCRSAARIIVICRHLTCQAFPSCAPPPGWCECPRSCKCPVCHPPDEVECELFPGPDGRAVCRLTSRHKVSSTPGQGWLAGRGGGTGANVRPEGCARALCICSLLLPGRNGERSWAISATPC